MKRYIVEASTNGTFDIPAGAYGFAIKPTLKRSSPPSPYQGQRFEGIPGQFPVVLNPLTGATQDSQVISSAETVYSDEPLPAFRVFEAEPKSTWLVILMESRGETWREAESDSLGLLELDDVSFDGTGSVIDPEERGIIIRPPYRAFILYFKQQSDNTSGTVTMYVKSASGNIWKAGTIDTSVEPIAVRQVLAPGGELFLQADYVGSCHVEATVEIG